MQEKYYYSALTNAFYLYSLLPAYERAGTLPDDIIEISERWYTVLLESQSAGKCISANEYGQPVVTEQPAPTQEELAGMAEAKKAELLRMASDAISLLMDAVELEMATDPEKARLTAWKKYRVLLNRVDTAATTIEWPEVPDNVA